jgi:hypothetical protein
MQTLPPIASYRCFAFTTWIDSPKLSPPYDPLLVQLSSIRHKNTPRTAPHSEATLGEAARLPLRRDKELHLLPHDLPWRWIAVIQQRSR